jgi:transposase
LGHQTVLRAPGLDEVTYLFGTVAPFEGTGLFEIYDRKRSEEFCLHLEHVGELVPDHFLFVGCDNAPAHQSRETTAYLKDNQAWLEVVYFPTYSPNLNGMEHLWRYLRKQMTRNTRYTSLAAECIAICAWLEALSFEQIIQTLGTIKKLTKTK